MFCDLFLGHCNSFAKDSSRFLRLLESFFRNPISFLKEHMSEITIFLIAFLESLFTFEIKHNSYQWSWSGRQ